MNPMKITAPIALALAFAVLASSELPDVHKNHMPAEGANVPSDPRDMKDYLDRKLLALKPHYSHCAKTSSNATPRHACDDKTFKGTMKVVHEKIKERGVNCPKHLAHILDELETLWDSCEKDFTQCRVTLFNKDIGEAITDLDGFMFAAQEVRMNDVLLEQIKSENAWHEQQLNLMQITEDHDTEDQLVNTEDAVGMIMEQDPTVMSL